MVLPTTESKVRRTKQAATQQSGSSGYHQRATSHLNRVQFLPGKTLLVLHVVVLHSSKFACAAFVVGTAMRKGGKTNEKLRVHRNGTIKEQGESGFYGQGIGNRDNFRQRRLLLLLLKSSVPLE